jgi:hypothetical protein
VALVHERTIPTERPPLVGEVSANFCRYRVSRGQRDGSLRLYSLFSRPYCYYYYYYYYSSGLSRGKRRINCVHVSSTVSRKKSQYKYRPTNKPFQNVENFKYLSAIMKNLKCTHVEIKINLIRRILATTQFKTFCLHVPYLNSTRKSIYIYIYKQTPWSVSASELYRPSDRRFSAK